jgi:hypothetical protein
MFTSYQNQAALFNRLKNEMIGLYAKVNHSSISLLIIENIFEDKYSRANDYYFESGTIFTCERKCCTE